MTGTTWRSGALLLALLLLVRPAAAQDGDRPDPERPVSYRFDLRLDPGASTLGGTGTLRLLNAGAAPLEVVPLVLYPNRFRELDPKINDVNFDRYYSPWFDPGGLELRSVRDAAGRPLAWRDASGELVPEGVFVEVLLPEPLPPGRTVELAIGFLVTIPRRMGPFGRYRWDRVVLEGGYIPYVPSAAGDGRPSPWLPPLRARYDLDLRVAWEDEPQGVLLGRGPLEEARGPDGRVHLEGGPPLLAAGVDVERLLSYAPEDGAPHVQVYGEPGDDERARRLAALAQELGEFVSSCYLPAGQAPARLVFLEAPLRDRFTHVADQVILYSDRLFHVFFPLQSFHELEVARAVCEALVRQRLAGAELGPDRDWICEGLGWVITLEWFQNRAGLRGKDVRRGLGWLDFIPSVDSILRAPKFAGADVYYGRFHESWFDVPDELARALWRRQRGRAVLEKMREQVGTEALNGLVRETLAHPPEDPLGFRRQAAAVAGRELDTFFALWLGPVPEQNLVLEEVETLEELPDGTRRIRVRIRREGPGAARVGQVGEPVEVETEGADGQPVRGTWDGQGEEGEVVLVQGDGLLTAVIVDPDQRVAESYRGDNERPLLAKVLLNRFRVRVDLNQGNRNEAAIGLTLHPFYRYDHAIVLDGFYEQDERGVVLGYGYGFGQVIDERSYGAGVSGFVNLSKLTTGVLDDRTAITESTGVLASAGLGFSFDTRLNQANPTWGLGLNLGLEYSDKLFGTDFRFQLYTGSITLVYSLVRWTQLACELVGAQLEGTDIPTQRLLDAGGEDAVRGVETSRFVDKGLFAIRTELRQTVAEDLDISLLWLSWIRRVQLVVFLDAGDVGGSIDRIWRHADDWKWGAGAGVRLFGDVFGVTGFTLRFSVGVRIDERDGADPQYYFGAGQTF